MILASKEVIVFR